MCVCKLGYYLGYHWLSSLAGRIRKARYLVLLSLVPDTVDVALKWALSSSSASIVTTATSREDPGGKLFRGIQGGKLLRGIQGVNCSEGYREVNYSEGYREVNYSEGYREVNYSEGYRE